MTPTLQTKEEKPRYRVRFAARGCFGTFYYKIEKRGWFFWSWDYDQGLMQKAEAVEVCRILNEEDES